MSPTLVRSRPGDDAAPVEDPRLRARRLEVDAHRRRRRLRAVGALAIGMTVVVAGWQVGHSSVLGVDEIRVEGARTLGVDEVAAAAGIRRGQPLLEVDPAVAAMRARQAPLIADAVVTRSWSGRVVIRVTERVPVATVATGEEQVAVVDATGRVLGLTATPPPDLVPVEGVVAPGVGEHLEAPARDAVGLAAALGPGVRSRVVAVGGDAGGVTLRLRPCGRVLLGQPADRAASLATLTTVLAQVDLQGLDTIDLRVPDAPVLTRSATCT